MSVKGKNTDKSLVKTTASSILERVFCYFTVQEKRTVLNTLVNTLICFLKTTESKKLITLLEFR